MKFIRGLFAPVAILFTLMFSGHALGKDRVTILYDAFSDNKTVTKDWGFSALVEHDGKRILFDTGNNPDIYVPSDGANGFGGGELPPAYFRPEPSLSGRMRYFDGAYPEHARAGKLYDTGHFVLVDKLTEVAPGIFLVYTVSRIPRTLELPELTLAIKGPHGLILVDGCSHSGIEEILQAARAVDPHTHIVFGGLHLVQTPVPDIDKLVDSLKNKWKLDEIAPGHCTGEPAFLRLQKAFGDDYLYAGAGTRLEIP